MHEVHKMNKQQSACAFLFTHCFTSTATQQILINLGTGE